MDLEFHQLELRHGDLRICDPARRHRLVASLAEQGQKVPVVVVAEAERYVLIDGYQRAWALATLGRDTVDASIWPLSEVEALLHHHHLSSSSRTPFEEAWFLARLHEQGMTLDELACRLCHSKSWVSRRLSLVCALSEPTQDKVRQGIVPPHAAMKYLVPLARANKQQCEALVQALGTTRVSDRDLAAIYDGWRRADALGRLRICDAPLLYLRALTTEKAKKPAGDEPSLAKELATLSAVAWRAQQRATRDGLDFEATYARTELCALWRTAQSAFDSLAGVLQDLLLHAGSDHTDDHSHAS